MNPEIKKNWIEALNSGRYKQGNTYLRHKDRFCCLGVLCDLSELHQWFPSVEAFTYGTGFKLLPSDVADWAGLGMMENAIQDLIEANDRGVPFSEIAKMIEEKL